MKPVLLAVLLLSATVLLGCVQQQAQVPTPTPTPLPTSTPTPTQFVSVIRVTPTPVAAACVFTNGSCCQGGLCNAVEIDCVQGYAPHYDGCDANCTVIGNCVPVATSTPVARQLNQVYVQASASFQVPEEIQFDAKNVFAYSNGVLRLPASLYRSSYEMGEDYFSFKFAWDPDSYIKDRIQINNGKLAWKIGDDSYIVRMSGGNYGGFRALSFVNWSAPYQPAQKIDESLFYATGPVRVRVSLFRGEDGGVEANLTALATAVHSITPADLLADFPGGEEEITMTVDAALVPEIAAMHAVHLVEAA